MTQNIDQPVQSGSIKLFPAFAPFPSFEDPHTFTVGSFNTLFKHWVEDFPFVQDQHRKWNYRLPRLRRTIADMNCDIVCLQEVHSSDFADDFGNYFAQPHNGNYDFAVSRTKGSKFEMTQAMLWKRDKFALIDQDFRSRTVIMLFEHKVSHKLLFVISVHLEGHPSKFEERFLQMKSSLARVQGKLQKMQLQHTVSSVPVVICGDFNEGRTPSSVVYQQLTKDKLTANELKKLFGHDKNKEDYSHEFSFQEAYGKLHKKHWKPSFAGNGRFAAIDHVYYSHNNLTLHGVRQTVPDYVPVSFDTLNLPNGEFSSDHLPIAAVFHFHVDKAMSASQMLLELLTGKKPSKKVDKQKVPKKKRKKKTDIEPEQVQMSFEEMTSF